jgi:hypothetical protein
MNNNSYAMPAVTLSKADRPSSAMAPVPSHSDDLGSIADLFNANDPMFNSQLATNVPQPPIDDGALSVGMIAGVRQTPLDWEMPPRKRNKQYNTS